MIRDEDKILIETVLDLKKTKTIFFDYDGTLHNTMYIFKPAFLKTYDWLVKKFHLKERIWKDDEISQFIGHSSNEMWNSLADDLSETTINQAKDMLGKVMQTLLDDKEAQLYEGAIDVLNYLKMKGYNLVFISNCSIWYMDKHTDIFNLDFYFDFMVNAQMYNYIPKKDILKVIKDKFKEPMVIVGDRFHDVEAGKDNNIFSIACGYGFGKKEEMSQANLIIDDIKDLKNIF